MADITQTGLLIDGDTLYGAAVTSDVSAKVSVKRWRFAPERDAAPSAGQDGDIQQPTPDHLPSDEPPNGPTDQPTN